MKSASLIYASACMFWFLLSFVACGGGNEPASGSRDADQSVRRGTKPTHPVQEDLSRYMPQENRVSAGLTEGNLFTLEALPQATLGEYKKGGKTYQQFLFKSQNTGMAAVYLGHAKDAMTNPKFVAGFGGYFGEIGGKPVFAFVKGPYVTGLVGLSQADADIVGRTIAARIP